MRQVWVRSSPPPARRLGISAASTILAVGTAYGLTLMLGFLSLLSPDDPIGEPYFSILEILILAMAPAMVALMVALHAWAPPRLQTLSLVSVCLMVMMATVTCCVHMVILALSREPNLAHEPGMERLLAFKWPSAAYALDILAWDGFFALSMLFAAPIFQGSGLCRAIRVAMTVSGVLALAGLGGAFLGDMRLRDIGIVGYLGVFLVVNAMLLTLFLRARRHDLD